MSRWPNKYVIGLTGNIAVGKSVVRQMLQHLGAYTIDADGLSHQAMQPGAPAYKPIVEAFGQFILDQDNRINRALLGNIVFSNKVALAKLEAIIHPIVGQAINTLVSRSKQRVIVIEAIKLLEGDLAASVDSIWVVNASPQAQYQRLIQKRKLSEADAKQRILSQNSQQEKLTKADVVINNSGNAEETWKQVQAEWAKIRTKLTGGAPTATPAAQPQAAQPQAARPAAAPAVPAGALKVEIKRGMPGNAEIIANFITESTAHTVSRMDIMLAFGQKSYLLAHGPNDHVVGLIGWQVENLITRADEFYLAPNVPPGPVVSGLVNAIEEASKALQSEVGFIFLPPETSQDILQPFLSKGYETTTIKDIKIPAWREAVQEMVTSDTPYTILIKKLREDRVLQPL
ncbi:MAG: dephospho-CoA kinase [Anaerolineae bacterium]|nr:dephospho-CoA kinase [Anaerolineae bacterium]